MPGRKGHSPKDPAPLNEAYDHDQGGEIIQQPVLQTPFLMDPESVIEVELGLLQLYFLKVRMYFVQICSSD